MKSKYKKVLEDTFEVMGMVYLSIIIISFFTKTPDIFYSSRIFVLIYFSINLLFKTVKTNK